MRTRTSAPCRRRAEASDRCGSGDAPLGELLVPQKSSSSLDRSTSRSYSPRVTGKVLLRKLRALGCEELRQRGSHVVVKCGECTTVVPVHAGEDLGKGLLRAIQRDLEPCLGKGWLQ